MVHGVEKSQTQLSDFHFREGQVRVYPAKASHSELGTVVMLINSTIFLLSVLSLHTWMAILYLPLSFAQVDHFGGVPHGCRLGID